MAGEISSRVLQQDTALKTLQNTMLLLVLDTMEGMQDEEAEANMLEKACALYAELQKQLSSSAHLSSKAEWHGSAKKLLARLEQVIAYVGKGWAIRTWKQSGPEEIAPALANCKHLAPELQPVLSLAKNAPHLKNLVPVEVDKKDLNAVLKYVKKGLTVASMDTSVMGDFLPEEEVNKVVAYKDSVMKALEEATTEIKRGQTSIEHIIEKYRQGHSYRLTYITLLQLLLHTVQTYKVW